ncbi:protein-tyrosine phosphatase family protein [Candidatus Electronema sp. JM]|uniref:protein-tyrosine phosphatase family protein n=1 Tax=Candidatus Electronema sp. JM TaxID=3401571 RepID=UPI003AA8EBD5
MEIFQIDKNGQLFISPSIDDWQIIANHDITVVCDMDYALDKGVPQVLDELLYIYCPFEDDTLPNLQRLHSIARLCANLVLDGYNIVSHCGMGHNRSALLMGVILTYLGLSGEEAVALIRQKRQGALYNKIYANYLLELPKRSCFAEWYQKGLPDILSI